MKKFKILFVTGSLRANSFNRTVARLAGEMVKDRADYEILDWADVPMMNEDIEFPPPEAVARVRAKVAEADGVWFFTPEYNHSLPGVLKNLVDWLSRPAGEAEERVLTGKPATISGVAAGPFGAILALEQLSWLINYLDMDVMNQPRTAVPSAYSLIEPDGSLKLGDKSEEFLRDQAEAFLAFLESRVGKD